MTFSPNKSTFWGDGSIYEWGRGTIQPTTLPKCIWAAESPASLRGAVLSWGFSGLTALPHLGWEEEEEGRAEPLAPGNYTSPRVPEHSPGEESEFLLKAPGSTAEVLQLEMPRMPKLACRDTDHWTTASLPEPAGLVRGPGNCISHKCSGEAHAAGPGPQFKNHWPEGYLIEKICFLSKRKYV